MGVMDTLFGSQYTAGKAHRDAAREAAEAIENAATAKIAETEKAVAEKVTEALKNKTIKGAEKAAEKRVNAALKAAGKPSLRYRLGQEGVFGVMKGGAKKAGIAAAIVGGIAALGIAARSMAKNRSRVPANAGMADLDALEASMAPAAMETGPADGRAPNEWQSKVRPGAAQQVAAQPAMTAVPEQSVQDLSPSRGV